MPWTLCGLSLGLAAIVTGGRCQRVGRVLEFHGGVLPWSLDWVPIAGGAAAMTLGHVVIAQTQECLDRSRRHELVHVAQYERWGPALRAGLSGLFRLALAARLQRVSRQPI